MSILYIVAGLVLTAFLVWSFIRGDRQIEQVRLMEIRAKLNSFMELEKGWYAYDNPPVDPLVIANASYLVDCMEMTGKCGHWEVFPCPDGTIQFDLDHDAGKNKYWFIVNVEKDHYALSTNSDSFSEGKETDPEVVFDWMLRAMPFVK